MSYEASFGVSLFIPFSTIFQISMKSQQIHEVVSFLKHKGIDAPHVGIILGTGLGNLATRIEKQVEMDYADIPLFPLSTVEFHKGKLIYGHLAGKKVVAMQGRFHSFEGYTMQQITFPVRVMKLLGVKYLLISNAAGSMNPLMKNGSLMVIDDHINLQPVNPLTGENDEQLGPRFPDMSQPYDASLIEKIEKIAEEMNLPLHKGVYVAVQGPNLETRAEYRFLRTIGADAVGMSTVPEVIVANHMSLPVAAVSVITDECDPDNLKPINIDEIVAIAGKAEMHLSALFEKLIEQL
ncbi:MAG TPA: purine-nucleoside phosphorylase [Chitinophagales bacterium]|nr:purine-nucleoside phosphorylase [Chitinophagales bacterium]